MSEPRHRRDLPPAMANIHALRERAALVTDGKNRALRTFIVGLATDVLAAVVLLLAPIVSSAQSWGDFDWRVMGFMLAKTAVSTAFSYLLRTVIDRSRIPTPLPPSDPGEPDDESGATSTATAVALAIVAAVALVLVAALWEPVVQLLWT